MSEIDNRIGVAKFLTFFLRLGLKKFWPVDAAIVSDGTEHFVTHRFSLSLFSSTMIALKL